MIVKDGTGRVRGEHLTGPGSPAKVNGYRRGGTDMAMIDTADVSEIGILLTPHSSALALMVEHTWIHKPMETVSGTGGTLVAAVRIPVGSSG